MDKDGALQRNGIAQYWDGQQQQGGGDGKGGHGGYGAGPVFLHQHTMKDPSALRHIAYPTPDKRPHQWTYCARLHRESKTNKHP